MIINLKNNPMRCVYFRLNQRRLLKKELKDLKKHANSNNEELAHKSSIKLSMIYHAIDFAAKADLSDFRYLIKASNKSSKPSNNNSTLDIPNFSIVDDYLLKNFNVVKHINICNLQLIKNVGIPSYIKNAPVFEIRIHGETSDKKTFDFGFRCIFFVDTYPPHDGGPYYQCYVKPISKNKEKYKGNRETNVIVKLTYDEYKSYRHCPIIFSNEFKNNNLINPQCFV